MTLAARLNRFAARPNETVIPIGERPAVNLKSKTCLIWDNGVFTELAVTLAKDFGRVLYYVPWTSGMPKSNALMIGEGLDGVERVASPWSYYDDIDLWVFPDVYEGDLQDFLVSQGKRVWGCRSGACLEIDRPASKEESKKLGIDIGPYKVITGLDALREHLKANDDQWVKISGTRGDMETFGAKSYEKVEPRLDELEGEVRRDARKLGGIEAQRPMTRTIGRGLAQRGAGRPGILPIRACDLICGDIHRLH